jgi:DsbE subfamily thiol:disulfide oxidoreductase
MVQSVTPENRLTLGNVDDGPGGKPGREAALMLKGLTYSIMTLTAAVMLTACGKPPQLATVGKPAPDFSLTDRQGRTWKLSKLKGQVVLVNFWASWCPPCREEIPSMENLYRSLPADRFKMLSILYKDEPAAADTLAATLGVTFPVLVDPGDKTGLAYGLTGVPETFIVDKKGILREKFIGPRQWDTPQARQMLMRYLTER